MEFEFKDETVDVKEIMKQIKIKANQRNISDQIDDLRSTNNLPNSGNASFSNIEKLQYNVNRQWNYTAEYPIVSHRKLMGSILVFGKKVVRKLLRWYVNPVVEKQVGFNATMVQVINEFTSQFKQMNASVEVIEYKLKELQSSVNVLQKQLDNKNDDIILQVESRIAELETKYKASLSTLSQEEILDEYINSSISNEQVASSEEIVTNLSEIESSLVVHGYDINKISSLLSEQQNTLIRLENDLNQRINDETNHLKNVVEKIQIIQRVNTERIRRMERKNKRSTESLSITPTPLVENASDESLIELEGKPEFDYFLFEELYRGSREEIKEKQKAYLPYFTGKEHVLDLGCGRGEFIELLIENGVRATGVELHDEMVEYCKDKGFNVVQEDLLSYLKSVPSNSIGGIFLGQVIEHLSPEQIIILAEESNRVLMPTSWIIAETPNPRTLSVFTNSFYMDITHDKPVHPETAKFIFDSAGFYHTEIGYTSPNQDSVKLPKLQSDSIDNVNEFNQGVERINEILFGYQDFFIAAQK